MNAWDAGADLRDVLPADIVTELDEINAIAARNRDHTRQLLVRVLADLCESESVGDDGRAAPLRTLAAALGTALGAGNAEQLDEVLVRLRAVEAEVARLTFLNGVPTSEADLSTAS